MPTLIETFESGWKRITACCKCGKVKQEDGTWAIDNEADPNLLSHGYCPDCLKIEVEDLKRRRK